MGRDYIVEEVRKHRREIEEESGNDFNKIIAKAIENQKTWVARKVLKANLRKHRTNRVPAILS